jgi:DinB superfamily
MKELAVAINQKVASAASELLLMADSAFFVKKLADKWSNAEIVGHLVDSAQNNLQRFIRGQYEATAPKILYSQNDWVDLGHYRQYNKADLVQLWVTINKHVSHVLTTMSAENYSRKCMTGSGEEQPLQYFAEDYLRHMNHHLEQISNN